MKSITAALWGEVLKIRRSKVLWIILAGFSFIDVVMGFFMFVLKNPDAARRYGLIAAKASLAGQADWPSFLGIVTQAIAAGGMIGFGFITSWVFGREHADRTIKDLLALPASRAAIVLAKFIAVGAWCALLAAWVLALALAVGGLVGLGGWDPRIITTAALRFAATTALTILPLPFVAFFASSGRGYLPALGFVILTVILAQVVVVLGYGSAFPWAVPALHSWAGGEEAARMGAGSYILVFGTGLSGLLGTLAWWRFADQT